MSFFDRDDTRAPGDQRPHDARATHPHPDPRMPNLEELLVSHRAATHQMLDGHQQLVKIIEKLERPARVEPIILTSQQAVVESGALTEGTKSIGLYNPSGSIGSVRLGAVGSSGVADAFVVPPGKLLVLPIDVGVVEIGTNFPLGANDSLYCFLIRYSTVQPAFLGGDDGEATTREINIAQPAGGAEWSTVVPAGQWWKLQTLFFSLVTSATAGGRFPMIQFTDAAGNLRWRGGVASNMNLGASSSGNYSAARLGPVVQLASAFDFFLPDLWIPPGYTIGSLTSGLATGAPVDQYSAVRALALIATEPPLAS